MKQPASRSKSKFIDNRIFVTYTQPTVLETAQKMLTEEALTEEGFLGAQAVLMLNGIL